MGEVDTKPMESVQVAIAMFGEKHDQKRRHSFASSDSENDKERDVEIVMKELGNYKLQLEAKDSAHKQALLKLAQYQKSIDELSTFLENSIGEREKSTEECKLAHAHINELEYEIMMIKMAATESLKEKEAKIELLLAEEVTAQEKLIDLRKQLEVMEDLENQVLNKTILIDSLQLELNQANETLASNEQDMKILEGQNKDQIVCVEALEIEKGQLKIELYRANTRIEILKGELQKAKIETDEIKEKENEAQIKVAILKSEVHQWRSKMAAMEAAELRLPGPNYPAAQETEIMENSPEGVEFPRNNYSESKERTDNNINASKTISLDQEKTENENLRKDLEMAMARIAEFRTRAEQAITRAESAERAKFVLEGQLRRYKEQRQRRKAALEALKDECISVYNPPARLHNNNPPKTYQPLGEILSMEF